MAPLGRGGDSPLRRQGLLFRIRAWTWGMHFSMGAGESCAWPFRSHAVVLHSAMRSGLFLIIEAECACQHVLSFTPITQSLDFPVLPFFCHARLCQRRTPHCLHPFSDHGDLGGALSTVCVVQLFGRLAVVETHTLWYFGHRCCLVVGSDVSGIWHFWIFTHFYLFAHIFLLISTTSTLFPHRFLPTMGTPRRQR